MCYQQYNKKRLVVRDSLDYKFQAYRNNEFLKTLPTLIIKDTIINYWSFQ